MLASQKFKDRILDSYKSGNYSIVEQDATYLISKGFTDPWLCNLLAISLAKQKKYLQAIKYFEILCQLNPNDSDSFFNLGNLYRDAKNPDLAIKYYKIAYNINPNHLETITEISKIFYMKSDFDNSLKYALKAKRLYPNSYKVIDLFGQIYFLTGDFNKSLNEYKKLDKFAERKRENEINIASNLFYLGYTEKAKKLLEGNKLDKAMYNLGLVYLKEKNFAKGWEYYDIGINIKERYLRSRTKISSSLPLWSPDKKYKSILVVGEQGLGDEIMFSTLLNNLCTNKYQLGLHLDKRLKNLFSYSGLKHEFLCLINDEVLQKYESYLPIGSLCKYFLKNESDFVNLTNFKLKVNEDEKYQFKSLINNNKINIGISWHTNNKQQGSSRNIKLKQFLPLFKLVEANFINLQYGDHSEEISKVSKKLKKTIFLEDGIDNKLNLDSFAVKLSACDLVISIDNSTLHFAGILGKETIGLIPEIADWRWFNDGKRSLWYPKTQLFRKSISWDDQILKVIEFCKNKFVKIK